MATQSTEEQVVNDLKSEESMIIRFIKSPWAFTVLIVIVILALAGGIFYWKLFVNRVSIDDAVVTAPEINLSPTTTGTLQALYVHDGDIVPANTPVARVGNEVITTQVESEVIDVQNNIGKVFNSGDTVVTVIDPSQLRVVGTLAEDKGLAQIKVGQTATFTVDTFGSQKFTGVVDEISPSAHADDVVFNISDQREVSEYDVKVRFDVSSYPQIKNGMSAKLTVFTK